MQVSRRPNFRFILSTPSHHFSSALPIAHSQPRLLTMPDPSSSIHVSCQQTRFHIAEGADNKEVSLSGFDTLRSMFCH
jgi:hypothetical protein